MRISLEFNIKETHLPSNYKQCFISFIKKALGQVGDKRYLEKYYTNTTSKPFMFTVVFHKPKFSKAGVSFEGNKVKMYFSVTDQDRASYIFMNCFLKMKYLDFELPKGNKMMLTEIRQIKEKSIEAERAVFGTTCSSMVLVREHNRETNRDYYYTLQDECYKDKLTRSIQEQCRMAGFGEDEIARIRVNEVEGKKIVVRHYNTLIDGVSGVFDISAPKVILNYIKDVGVGSRRSFGFCYLNVLEQKEG